MRFAKITLMLLFVPTAYAEVPSDFLFENKPIDALCFYDLKNNDAKIQLKNCGLAAKHYVFKGVNAKLIKKSFTGYNWQYSKADNHSQGYSYYQYFNAGNHNYWIYTINSGGGSGEFAALYLAKRNGDVLDITALAAGDRCNQGLSKVSVKNHQLTYAVNLTAYDFLKLSKLNLNVKAYDEVASCAVCCVAKAVYTVTANATPQLSYVDINDAKNTNEMPQQGSLQACFNNLLKSYIDIGEMQFKQEIMDEFADKFKEVCVD